MGRYRAFRVPAVCIAQAQPEPTPEAVELPEVVSAGNLCVGTRRFPGVRSTAAGGGPAGREHRVPWLNALMRRAGPI